MFPVASVSQKLAAGLDHVPMLLTLDAGFGKSGGGRHFMYEAMWDMHANVKEVITSIWTTGLSNALVDDICSKLG